MDGEVDGAQATGQEQQGQQAGQAVGDEQQKRQEALQVGAVPTDEEICAALAERDQKIAELERRVAEASKTIESAEALARQIEELRAASEKERVGFGLRHAGEPQSRRVKRQGDHDPEDFGHGPGWLHAKRGLQNRLHRFLLLAASTKRFPLAMRMDGATLSGQVGL